MELCDKAVQTEGFEELIDEWLEWDKNPDTHEEIKALKDLQKYSCLKLLIKNRLKFGTSGIRARMGAGFSRMNDLVVIQTTQGLVSYLESIYSEQVQQRGVVIGFDARHYSRRFAELTTTTFLDRGIRVYLFSDVCPTAFVPFCVNINKCVAGIMITASHSPKYDNGYKLYWENGVQIIPPHDQNITAHILQNLEPWDNAWDTTVIKHNLLVRDPLIQISGMYFRHLRRNVLQPEINITSNVKITYTAMHGVSQRFMVEAFKAGSFKPFVSVGQQKDPNPDFPTLEFPNPEEKYTLNLAIKIAEENNSTLVLATDPDGDRLAVAEKYQGFENEEEGEGKEEGEGEEDGEEDVVVKWADVAEGRGNEKGDHESEPVWRVFTANELGALLGWWALYSHRQTYPSADLSDVYMLGTVVTSRFLQAMAQTEGFTYEETPAGFKSIANRAYELTTQGKTVLFGFDEPNGFMMGTLIFDKDGISAGVNVAALAAHLGVENLTLGDKLEELYVTYGHHVNLNACLVAKDQNTIDKIFHRLRNFCEEPNTYPDSVDEGKYIVISVRDFTTGYDSTRPDEELTGDTSVNEMIRFVFDNGVSFTVRDSSMDTKIKYYTDMYIPPDEEDVWTLREMLVEMIDAIVNEFFQPEIHGLITQE